MSWKLGLGRGLQSAGDLIARWGSQQAEQKWRTEQAAMERALTEQRLGVQDKQADSQGRYYEALAANQTADNERADVDWVTKNFGGQEVSPSVADMVPERYRSLLVQQDDVMKAAPMPEGMPVPAGNFETLQSKTSIRKPETAGERIADTRATAQLTGEQMRQTYLMKKLAQDKELAGMTDATRRAQIDAQLKAAGERIAATYAGIDARLAQAAYETEADAIIEREKIAARQSNPLIGLIMGAQPGGVAPSGGAPIPKPTAPQTPMPPPPSRGGAPRPQASTAGADPLGILTPRPKP
jgi:hypothetical protein